MTILNMQIHELVNRYELSQHLLSETKIPTEAIQIIFTKIIKDKEINKDPNFTSSLCEKIWQAVSKERIITLKNSLVLAFCDKVLCHFNEDEVEEMLQDYKKKELTKSLTCRNRLHNLYSFKHKEIMHSIFQEACSTINSFSLEIEKECEKEGIRCISVFRLY